jgi:hypothetical protein
MEIQLPHPVVTGHGTVTKAITSDGQIAPVIRNDPTPTMSDKQPFDDSPVPGLVDHPNEGGSSPAGSTGAGYKDGVSNTGSYFEQAEDDNRFSLMGFKVAIRRADGTVEGHDIRMNFDDRAVAMACVSGNVFKCKTPQGEDVVGEITSGMPIICTGGATSLEYAQVGNGTFIWRRI